MGTATLGLNDNELLSVGNMGSFHVAKNLQQDW